MAPPAKQDPVQSAGIVSTPKTKAKAIDTAVATEMASATAATADTGTLPTKPATTPKDVPPTAESNSKVVAAIPKVADPSSGSLTRSKSSKNGKQPDLVQPSAIPQLTRDGQSTLTRALGLKIGRIVIDAAMADTTPAPSGQRD